MILGLSSYTYTWAVGVPGREPPQPLTAIDLLDRTADLGLHLLQVADNLPLHALPEEELAELAQGAAARDIQLELGARGIDPAHLTRYLRLAQRLGSPLLRVVVDTADHHPTRDEVVAILAESLPAFRAAGVLLALENHDRFSREDYLYILEAVADPALGICLDTVNSFGALEGPRVVVEALAPWTVNLHIKDFVIHRADHMMGFTIEGAPAGQGRLDIPWLLAYLAAQGRNVNAVLELWTPPERDLEATLAKEDAWARKSVAYLRQLVDH